MKTRLVVVLPLLIGALCWPTVIVHAQDSVVGPSRADMDRLLTDVGNHNRKLGELLTSRDLSQIKQEAQYLREDVKSLARKSTGLLPPP